MLRAVSRRVYQFAGTLILLLATLTPLMECFDRWDRNPGPANDTEIHLTAWFVGVGVVLTLVKLLRHVPVLAVAHAPRHTSFQLPASRLIDIECPTPTGSPPPLLPLRI